MKNMLKKFGLLVILFTITISVSASSYSNYDKAVKNTDTFITKFDKYSLFIDTTNKYLYDGTLSSKNGFKNGGFINTYEFNLTTDKNNNTYLSTGSRYFTMTDYDDTVDIVDIINIVNKNKSESFESRITEYIRYFVKVNGSGTRTNPWVFVDNYTYNLLFNPMGGNVTPNSKKVTVLEKYGDLPVPTRVGYDFKGWYFENSYINEVKSDKIVEIDEDTTVYAKWEIKKYNVTLTVSNGSSSPTSVTVKHFDNAVFNLTPNSNYEFTNSKVTCDNGATGSVSNNTITVSNITANTNCSISATPMYTCSVGTLKYDTNKGYICTKSGTFHSGDCDCYTTSVKCGCKSASDFCSQYNDYDSCMDASWICMGPIESDCCFGDNYCDRDYCDCYDDYYSCDGSWNNYSGSGSSLVCYKAATLK